MGLYETEKARSDLQNNYANDDATNAYARFISQQRFARQKQDLTQGYQRQFPQFTGNYAHQLGSGIHSGVFGQKLNQFVGDYGQAQGRLAEDQAGDESNFQQMYGLHQGQYQQALLALNDELGRQQAMTNPYQGYQGVY